MAGNEAVDDSTMMSSRRSPKPPSPHAPCAVGPHPCQRSGRDRVRWSPQCDGHASPSTTPPIQVGHAASCAPNASSSPSYRRTLIGLNALRALRRFRAALPPHARTAPPPTFSSCAPRTVANSAFGLARATDFTGFQRTRESQATKLLTSSRKSLPTSAKSAKRPRSRQATRSLSSAGALLTRRRRLALYNTTPPTRQVTRIPAPLRTKLIGLNTLRVLHRFGVAISPLPHARTAPPPTFSSCAPAHRRQRQHLQLYSSFDSAPRAVFAQGAIGL
ncbi:hypothetical protein B0H12DRAFT_1232535 [Mycena haematopus]|nr:hypothetical protein B0H12DRAFT_1232535 [Mycena haematopus]